MVEDLKAPVEGGPGWVSGVYGGAAWSLVDKVNERVNLTKKYLARHKLEADYGLRWFGNPTEAGSTVVVFVSGAMKGPVEALEQLDAIEADAAEMGYEAPQDAVVSAARRILGEMYSVSHLSFDAYSMSGGRVAIGVDGGVGRSMIVICEPEGSALCVVTVGSRSRRARYDDSSFLVDDFVKQGLRDMVAVRESVAASEL